jgi:hypothetical protein
VSKAAWIPGSRKSAPRNDIVKRSRLLLPKPIILPTLQVACTYNRDAAIDRRTLMTVATKPTALR